MVPGFTGCAFAMAALAVAAFLHLSLGWYVALFFCAVALQALTGGSIQTIGADVAPPQARGTFLGVWRFTGQAGTFISPVVFAALDRKSTRLNSSHDQISYAVFCLKKKKDQ